MFITYAYHLELQSISNKHAIPRSDIRFSPNTTLCNQLIIAFASLSSNELYPVSPLLCSLLIFTISQSHLPISLSFTSNSVYSCWHHKSAPHSYINLFTTKPFHPSLPITYLLYDLCAANLTIPRTPFASSCYLPPFGPHLLSPLGTYNIILFHQYQWHQFTIFYFPSHNSYILL